VLAELNRRRVFRALVGYGIAAFALLQIIEPVMHESPHRRGPRSRRNLRGRHGLVPTSASRSSSSACISTRARWPGS